MNCEKKTEGSLTVEAAVILPLFFMACLTLTLFMNALKTQTEKNLELSSKARTLAIAAGCASAGISSSGRGAAEDAMISADGSEAAGNRASEDAAWIDLTTTQLYEPPFSLFHLKKIRILCRARVYPWIGSENGVAGSGNGNGTDESASIYITDRQLAYHLYADCTHLNLTVIQTTSSGVKNMRNSDGKKYKKCRGFPKNYTGPVYLTPNGTYYYPSANYGSLTRHVHIANKDDYPDLKLCERCAARKRAG